MSPNEEDASEDSGEAAQAPILPADLGTAPLKKKTISCTQCRRRKLKCDRVKPSCATCSRLRHQCVYPEGRMKSTAKRRNVKDLEARLAQVESLLNSEATSKPPLNNASMPAQPDASSSLNLSPFWDGVSMDMGLAAEANDLNSSMHNMSLPLLANESFSYDLIGYGLEEQLPPQHLIDELHNIYFERIHPAFPLLHKYRYLATANLPPSLGPPFCLRYALWAIAASTAGMYRDLQEVFYRRARKYAETDEMKGQGGHFLSVAHVQAWALISNYEAENMCLSRAWVSAGRLIRMVQMMNLHRLDDETHATKQMIPPPRDWLELEERRRAFWAAFCCDRYSCAGSGWPMAIEERDIFTNLPSSDEAFDRGEMEATTSLSEAMTAEGASKISSYGGQVLMACLFGHNWAHLHRPGPNDNPQDPFNGKFWRRHRSMDNMISNLSMFLPDHLRLPGNIRDSKVVCLNMNIHTSTICLHQAAIMKAEKYKLDATIITQSQARCRAAAEEIVNIMRLVSHFDIAQMNTWMSFNLYVAAGVLIEGCHSPETGQHSRNSLEFLLAALSAMGSKRPVSKSFLAQLRIDLEAAGINSWLGRTTDEDMSGMEKAGGSIGPSSIYTSSSTRSRMIEVPFEMLNPSAASSSNLRSGTGSTATSTKESASPPIDIRNFHTMEGLLPKNNLNLRIRRKVNGWNPNGDASPGVNFMPDIGSEPVHHTYNADPATNTNNPSFPAPFAYRQELLKSTTTIYDRQSNSEISNEGKSVKVAPDFDYNSFVSEGSADFQFPLGDDQDLNSLFWSDSLFNKRRQP